MELMDDVEFMQSAIGTAYLYMLLSSIGQHIKSFMPECLHCSLLCHSMSPAYNYYLIGVGTNKIQL